MQNFLITPSSLKKVTFFAATLLFLGCGNQKGKVSFTELEKGFQTPPDSVKPYVYWYWINDNISEEGVVRDLKAMSEVGIGGAFIGNIGLEDDEITNGDIKLMSDKWWDITKKAITTASEEGIDIGLFNSPGWSQSGGPWVDPEESMRYLANKELRLKGPQKVSQKLPGSEGYFEDVAVLAFPAPAYDQQTIADYSPSVQTWPRSSDAYHLVDGDTSTVSRFPEQAVDSKLVYEIRSDEPFTARSLKLYPAPVPFKANAELQIKVDGEYQVVKTFEFDRSNPQATVGFKPYSPVALSFPARESNNFRIVFTNITNRGGLAEIALSSASNVERYMEKQLAKMFQTPLPMWKEYQWPLQGEPEFDSLTVNQSAVLNITDHLSEDGTLNWKVPEGEWVILRLGMKTTGVTNGPALKEGRGLEIDKINKEPLKAHFNAFIGRVLDSLSADERSAFKYVVADSYETGSQNWTKGFAKAFKEEFGYDPLPWLPVLTGRIVGSADQSNRFLWDMRRLIADRVAYQYVGGLRELSQQHNLKLWLENYGHWGFPAEFLQYGGQSNELSGEFWAEGDLGSIELTAAASAAHIYGKNRVWAESFTAAGKPFARYPGQLKKRGDWAFTQGVNSNLLHVYISQPYQDKAPGVNAWFGTEFNRKNTWFYFSDMFVDYLRRCMFMLQQGKPVVDVAYFIGEDTPKMTGVRKPELPKGYSYDYINAEVIRDRLSVKDGNLVLPDGVSYELLVLPKLETMRPELLSKIKDLVEEGAAILGSAPERSPSLENYPAADQEVKKLANKLWGGPNDKFVTSRRYGEGLVMSGIDLTQALNILEVPVDVDLNSNDLLYTHRTTPTGEIYYLTNQTDKNVSLSSSFRVTGMQPEFWNPVTGKLRRLPEFKESDYQTKVPIKLAPFQSCFIIFRDGIGASADSIMSKNFPEPALISAVDGPWKVTFDSTRRGPDQAVEFDTLSDWTKHPNEEIKYYSGSAVYETSFKAPNVREGERLFLDLGSVKVMAKVRINGEAVGGAWTSPWRVDITGAIQKGENTLQVEVVNTWVNRLIGDSKRPLDERETWTMVNTYTPDGELDSSGLLGPVTLQKVQY